jgi:hypothetical protein
VFGIQMFKKTAVYSVNETTPIHSFNPWKKWRNSIWWVIVFLRNQLRQKSAKQFERQATCKRKKGQSWLLV